MKTFTLMIMGSLVMVKILSKKEVEQDEIFKEYNYAGYHSGYTKEIVLKERELYNGQLGEEGDLQLQWDALKHEIIHAFLYECGLDRNSMSYQGSWATNEEMVDWFALQYEKIRTVMHDAELKLMEVNED